MGDFVIDGSGSEYESSKKPSRDEYWGSDASETDEEVMRKPKKKAKAFKAKKPRKPSEPKKKPKKKKRVLDSDDEEEEDSEDTDFETESRKKRHIKATQGQASRQTRGVALKYSLENEKEYSDDDD